ncbi:MAG: response regulator [Deltaproteobacteria bacterium]|nr:response regulator [Deltaproteobacteria bacterium]
MESDILKNKRLLIVDDEPDVLETLLDVLDMCVIDTAPNYETALKFLEKTPMMPPYSTSWGCWGLYLLTTAVTSGIPVLMLTAHALNPDTLVSSIKAGARAYVPKDEMADIQNFLIDLLAAREGTDHKRSRWFTRLKPVFDRKFGPGWREKDRSFWNDFDLKPTISREELEKTL